MCTRPDPSNEENEKKYHEEQCSENDMEIEVMNFFSNCEFITYAYNRGWRIANRDINHCIYYAIIHTHIHTDFLCD